MAGHLQKVTQWEEIARKANYRPLELAALCSVSPRQLERHFKATRQTTPRRWLRELQCRRARVLIEQGYSNKAVVEELKFSSESHFCHEFKRVFGGSPQSFAPIPGQNQK